MRCSISFDNIANRIQNFFSHEVVHLPRLPENLHKSTPSPPKEELKLASRYCPNDRHLAVSWVVWLAGIPIDSSLKTYDGGNLLSQLANT